MGHERDLPEEYEGLDGYEREYINPFEYERESDFVPADPFDAESYSLADDFFDRLVADMEQAEMDWWNGS